MRSYVPLLALCALSSMACSKEEEKPKPSTTTASSAPVAPPPTPEPPPPAPTPAPATGEPEASPEMKEFLGALDGTPAGTKKALTKYGGKTVQANPLGTLGLKDAKVTKSEKLGTLQCYNVESTAGTTKHDTRFCWDSAGKIAQITDKKE
ncbi:hypothetical protein LZC95_52380 [Pendulispora brunnea]|uniref:Uncharacterized protein n=1 Tax=Pendulispora brunnea TaxID=2905690 RepID=A0ABZ2K8J9_9BACT